MTPEELVKRLHWLGHDTFRIDATPIIYIDPYKLEGRQVTGDLVLISHDHYDHLSPEDLDKVKGPKTIVVGPQAVSDKLPGTRVIKRGEKMNVLGVEIEAMPAYNVNKFRAPGQPFHPNEAGHVGYILTIEGVRLYFAGDTDNIPEMANIHCDVALLPVSGIYVMTAEEAAEAAQTIKPKIAIPMHYGKGIGTEDDAKRFAKLYGGKVEILKQE